MQYWVSPEENRTPLRMLQLNVYIIYGTARLVLNSLYIFLGSFCSLAKKNSFSVAESIESEGWLRGIVVTDKGKRLGNSGTIPTTYVKQVLYPLSLLYSVAPVDGV